VCPQARVLAWWREGIALTRACGRLTGATFLALLLGQKVATVEPRLYEWCGPAAHKAGAKRQALDVTTGFVPLLRWVVALWAGTQMALARDATSLGARFGVLTLHGVYRGGAVPVAWTVWPAHQPGAWGRAWWRLLRQVRPAIPPNWTVAWGHGNARAAAVAGTYRRNARLAAVPRAPELPGLGDYLAPRTPLTRQLFHRLDQAIRALSPDILAKVTRGQRHQGGVSYASPELVFIYVKFQIRHGLSLDVFTRDQAWPGVAPRAAHRWGALRVRTKDELVRAMEVAKRSYGAIKAAIAQGEPTGMHGVRQRAARARQSSHDPWAWPVRPSRGRRSDGSSQDARHTSGP
jgi:hypothetical protein